MQCTGQRAAAGGGGMGLLRTKDGPRKIKALVVSPAVAVGGARL
jgi:hypothetical protein